MGSLQQLFFWPPEPRFVQVEGFAGQCDLHWWCEGCPCCRHTLKTFRGKRALSQQLLFELSKGTLKPNKPPNPHNTNQATSKQSVKTKTQREIISKTPINLQMWKQPQLFFGLLQWDFPSGLFCLMASSSWQQHLQKFPFQFIHCCWCQQEVSVLSFPEPSCEHCQDSLISV